KVKTGLDTFVATTNPTGQAIVTNMGTGIDSKNKDMVTTVTKLTKSIIDQFNKGFGIASPSKVMYQIGDYLMQGLINGMSSADIEGFITNKISGMTGSAGGVLGANLVTEAEKYLGTPYVWGGTNTNGFDCSGLVQYVYKQLGVSIGRTTSDQVKQGTAVAKKDLQPGDIVFFGGTSSNPEHEAMYMGNGMVIQAPHTGDVVKETKLSEMGSYDTARRIITASSDASAKASGTSIDIIKQALTLTNTSQSWLASMTQLLSKENTSGNQSTVSKVRNGNLGFATGMFQMMQSTFNANASANHGNILNGVDNTMSAINYIKKQYGNPNNIKNLYNSNYVGYDTGTDDATAGYHDVAETAPELVMSKQTRNFKGGETVFDGNKTSNLMSWGSESPTQFMNSIMPKLSMPDIKITIPNNLIKSGNIINIANIELPQVFDGNSFMNELTGLANVRG
ncbi:MAG TPA: NlpC/P60 family protein, partial [Clostridium sp.]